MTPQKDTVEVFTKKPDDFISEFDVVGCFVEVNGEILLLQRQDDKAHPNTWGLPAGKMEGSESPIQGMIRELFQETGLKAYKNFLKPQFTVYVRYADMSLTFHVFSYDLSQKFDVKINPQEHKDFLWVTPDDALTMPLVGGLYRCIRLCYFR